MSRRGRPKKSIKWPEDMNFTTNEIKELSEEKLSNGLIHIKLKEAIQSGEIEVIGKTSSNKKGRPKYIYRKTK